MKLTNRTKNQRKLFAPKKKFTCPNCLAVLEKGEGHFFPPCFGEGGFWICEEPMPPDVVKIIDGNFWKLVA